MLLQLHGNIILCSVAKCAGADDGCGGTCVGVQTECPDAGRLKQSSTMGENSGKVAEEGVDPSISKPSVAFVH